MKKNKNIFAHRGYYDNINIPENSIKAFQKALDNKLNIELDIQILKDNTIIVYHDYNLKRMTGLDKKVKDCTYEDIKKLTLLNTEEKIPLLKDVLNLINTKASLLIDIKNEHFSFNLESKLLNLLNQHKGNYYVSSFNLLSIIYLKRKKTKYNCGLIIYNSTKFKVFFTNIINKVLNSKYIKVDFISCNKKGIKYLNQNLIKKNKLSTFVWTIKSKKEYLKFQNTVTFYIIDYNSYINSTLN